MVYQLLLPLPPHHSYDQGFIRSEANAMAHSWVMRYPDWPLPFSCVFGPTGSGKTHLAHLLQKKSGGLYIDASCETSLPEPSSLSHACYIVDHAEKCHEEWLFHFYNHIFFTKGSLLLLSATAPNSWDISLKDLKSRLATVYTIEINDPDEDLFGLLLHDLLLKQGITLDPTLYQYISRRVERTYTMIHILAERINDEILRQHKSPTLPLIKAIIEPFL